MIDVLFFTEHLHSLSARRVKPASKLASKMATIEQFDTFLPCARDFEHRGGQVDQTWQHNVRDEKDQKAVEFLKQLWAGKLNGCMSECFKRNSNWKEALTNPLPWLEELGQCRDSSKLWQFMPDSPLILGCFQESLGG